MISLILYLLIYFIDIYFIYISSFISLSLKKKNLIFKISVIQYYTRIIFVFAIMSHSSCFANLSKYVRLSRLLNSDCRSQFSECYPNHFRMTNRVNERKLLQFDSQFFPKILAMSLHKNVWLFFRFALVWATYSTSGILSESCDTTFVNFLKMIFPGTSLIKANSYLLISFLNLNHVC